LNWGDPEVSCFCFRVLSLFLKGTCTLLLGQSCVLLPPADPAVLVLPGREPDGRVFYLSVGLSTRRSFFMSSCPHRRARLRELN